jgi:hypothetical protein
MCLTVIKSHIRIIHHTHNGMDPLNFNIKFMFSAPHLVLVYTGVSNEENGVSGA